MTVVPVWYAASVSFLVRTVVVILLLVYTAGMASARVQLVEGIVFPVSSGGIAYVRVLN